MPRKKHITKKILFSKTVEIVKPWLQLTDWKIQLRFSKKMRDAAECLAYPEYRLANIRVNQNRFNELSQYEVVSTAIHEMLHCITWRFTEWTIDLCKKDKTKLEITRRLEEGFITELEKIITDLAWDFLQTELSSQNYLPLDPLTETLIITAER